MKIPLLLLALSFSLLSAAPEPSRSKYFYSDGGGFVLGGEEDNRIVQYAVTLKVLEPIPKGTILFFKFENPLAKKKPLEAKVVYNGEEKITVKSSAVWGLKPNGVYTYFVSLRSSEKAENQFGTHRQDLLFGMNEEQFNDFMMPWYKDKTEQNKSEQATPRKPSD